MGGRSEQDVEKLLRETIFSNPSHKAALRKRLFGENAVLSVDDLDCVMGGVMMELPKFEEWPDEPYRPWKNDS